MSTPDDAELPDAVLPEGAGPTEYGDPSGDPESSRLAELLPGRWRVVATNFPMWLKGDKRDPVIEYTLTGTIPLTLTDSVEYIDESGKTVTILGVDKLGHDRHGRDSFVWRGAGRLRLLRSRWAVAGVDEDLLATRFARSLLTPSGVDVLARDGVDVTEVRRQVAEHPELLGLTMEEFASLSWLG